MKNINKSLYSWRSWSTILNMLPFVVISAICLIPRDFVYYKWVIYCMFIIEQIIVCWTGERFESHEIVIGELNNEIEELKKKLKEDGR